MKNARTTRSGTHIFPLLVEKRRKHRLHAADVLDHLAEKAGTITPPPSVIQKTPSKFLQVGEGDRYRVCITPQFMNGAGIGC